MKPVKIIVLGFQTPVGQAILQQLAIHDFPSDQIFLLDAKRVRKKQFYQGEEKPVIDFKSFNWEIPFIVLICDKEISKYPQKPLPKHCWAIDCCSAFPKSFPIVSDLNPHKIKTIKNHVLCSPTSLTVVLSHVFSDLIKYQPIKTKIVALIGTSFLNQNSAQKLREQTRSVYTQIPVSTSLKQPPLAFNMIPQIKSEKASECPEQLTQILNLKVDFRHCFVPVFRGFCLFVCCHLKQKIKPRKTLWKNNPYLQVMNTNNENFILSSAATLTETKVFITNIKYHSDYLTFWVIGDDIQSGLTLNTIHIVKTLIKNFI